GLPPSEEKTAGSRKGLAGTGLLVRVRRGLLALAERDPARWLVLPNDGLTLEELEARVLDAVESHRPRLHPPDLEQLSVVAPPVARALPRRAAPSEESVRQAFFERLEALAEREPGVATQLLTGVMGSEAQALRERLVFST